jgi:hypothetical protein
MAFTDPHPTKSTAAMPKRRPRRLSADQLNALAAAVRRQHDSLDPANPRVKPTLPVLRFLARSDDGSAA